jgi:hypothetical protein
MSLKKSLIEYLEKDSVEIDRVETQAPVAETFTEVGKGMIHTGEINISIEGFDSEVKERLGNWNNLRDN